ncbi:hypothetical protein [Clostridium sp. UBA7791]|uniref:hypothetical protein n=1 Tax=Clostridium sp. UBA7791 TaxID=1946379 RepID=UPI0032177FBF
MKSSKIKQSDEMEVKDLKKLNVFISIGCMLGSILFNLILSSDDKVYHSIAPVLLVLTLILNVINIVLNVNKKPIYKSVYILIPIQGILVVLSLYLEAANCLTLESTITKIIIFFNFIIVNLYIFYKRIIVKNEDYISSVKKGTHGRYIKRDLSVSLIVTAILLTIAKVIDSSPIIIEEGNGDKFISGIFLIGVTVCLSIVYIIAISNYLYSVKDKKLPKTY